MKIKEDYVPKAKRLQQFLNQTKSENRIGKPASGTSASTATIKPPKILPKHLRTHQTHQKCPQCQQWIPLNEIERHLRIELLDPKWKQQKERELAKKRESNLIIETGGAVAESLNKLADFRQDIFGGDISSSKEKMEQARKEAMEKSKTAWDGTEATANAAWMKSQRMTTAEDVQQRWEELQRYQAQQNAMQVGPSLPPSRLPPPPPPPQ